MPKIRAAAVFAILFGALTVASGGSALFAGLDMGAVIGFVLWFNFLAGFAYVLAGIGLWSGKKWAAWLAAGLAGATFLIALAFVVQVLGGQPYETRTVGALVLRVAIWAWIAYVARPLIRPGT